MNQTEAVAHLRELAQQHTPGSLLFSDVIHQFNMTLVDYLFDNDAEDLAEAYETVVDEAIDHDLAVGKRIHPAVA